MLKVTKNRRSYPLNRRSWTLYSVLKKLLLSLHRINNENNLPNNEKYIYATRNRRHYRHQQTDVGTSYQSSELGITAPFTHRKTPLSDL
jgi:hypothetical protein